MSIKSVIFDASDVLYHHQDKNPQILGLIKDLSSKYKIGMITNLSTDSVNAIFSHDELTLFSYIHTYGKKGLVKPDPAVFVHAAEELGVKPENCIYVDDMYSNVAGASEAGMQTIVYKDFAMFKHQLTKILEHDE